MPRVDSKSFSLFVGIGGWERNCRSGIALAMCRRLSGLGKGDEHSAYAVVENGTFTFSCYWCQLPMPTMSVGVGRIFESVCLSAA